MKLLFKAISFYKKFGFAKTFSRIPDFLFSKIIYLSGSISFSAFKYISKGNNIIARVQENNMCLDLNDEGISKELLLTGIHEKNSTIQFKKVIKKGMHILEIGGNIGYYALIGANLVGPSGFVYAFEPSPSNFKLLKINVLLNDKEEIFELHNKAVGQENGISKFYLYTKSNISSFIKRDQIDGVKMTNEIEIEVVALDSFFENRKLDYIRMDVEGFEAEIIRGMEKVLSKKDSPEGLFIEIHSELLHQRDYTAKSFIIKLNSLGYEIEKSFYRGKSNVSVDNTRDLLNHPFLEKGYWETFFIKR